MQNWFAWNSSAKTHMTEYHATKYVFETQMQPDQVRDCDNQIFSISPAADPRQQLRAILSHGGGLPLAYSLMSDGLIAHTRILYLLGLLHGTGHRIQDAATLLRVLPRSLQRPMAVRAPSLENLGVHFSDGRALAANGDSHGAERFGAQSIDAIVELALTAILDHVQAWVPSRKLY